MDLITSFQYIFPPAKFLSMGDDSLTSDAQCFVVSALANSEMLVLGNLLVLKELATEILKIKIQNHSFLLNIVSNHLILTSPFTFFTLAFLLGTIKSPIILNYILIYHPNFCPFTVK